MNRDLRDALAHLNNKRAKKGKTPVTEKDLKLIKKSKDYRSVFQPYKGESSFLDTDKEPKFFRFGSQVPVSFMKDESRFKRISDQWKNKELKPLIVVDEEIQDGFHRATLAWYRGRTQYPCQFYKIEESAPIS